MTERQFGNEDKDVKWAEEVWEKAEKKLFRTTRSVGDCFFPYTTQNGRFVNPYDEQINDWWTDGFWTGILWMLYEVSHDETYREYAQSLERKLDAVLEDYVTLHHDVGFMWLLSSVADYRLTGSEKARKRGLHAAGILAGRFNPNGNFIRAWNDEKNGEKKTGLAIIDSMMNLSLLYWATEETGDPRYRSIAMRHADTLKEYAVRPDGSVKHILEFDPNTGEYIRNRTGQSYDESGSWTRGQAWALYGFLLSFLHTGKEEYLNTAKVVAHYFIAALQEDLVPPCDFRSPEMPVYKDTTAGACAACGLLEIADAVPKREKRMYRSAAVRILKSIEERYCNWSDEEDSIVQSGTEAYHFGDKNIPIIYGDYFFLEALLKLKGGYIRFW